MQPQEEKKSIAMDSIPCLNGKGEAIPRPTISFQDVIGHESAKKELFNIVQAIKNPQTFESLGIPFPRGYIINGPTGIGKTTLCKSLAHETNCTFIVTSLSELKSKSNPRKRKRIEKENGNEVEVVHGIEQVFAMARKHQPSILLFEEFDTMTRCRKDLDRDLVTELLTQLDGFVDRSRDQVIVIASTNEVNKMDKRLTRPGRFDNIIELILPDHAERLQLFRKKTERMRVSNAIDDSFLDYLASTTLYFTGAEIESICNDAGRLTIRNQSPFVSPDMFEEALEKHYLGFVRARNRTAQQDYQVAVHESGHACISLLQEALDKEKGFEITNKCIKLTIVPHDKVEGAAVTTRIHDEINRTKHSCENEIRQSLGGMVAEELVFGKKYTCCGSASDMHKVYHSLLRMSRSGLLDFYVCTGTDRIQDLKKDLNVHNYVESLKKEATHLLLDNKEVLVTLAKNLVEKRTLSRKEIENTVVAVSSHLKAIVL